MSLKTVLITGASAGGIGSALALSFQKRGLHVFATVRNPQKAAHLASLPNVSILELDVTSSASIAAAVEAVRAKTEGRGLDFLVNNSGSGYSIPLLDADLEEGRKLFEVNLWGMLGVIQKFAPLLVKAGGTVVNISSVGGEVNAPWIGIYTASKAATTCLSETLRLELAPLGVKVITAMVGVVKSNFMTNIPEFHLPSNSYYSPIKSRIAYCAAGKNNPKGMDVDVFAAKVVADVVGGAQGRIWRGNAATLVWFASRFIPSFVVDRLTSGGQGLDELVKWVKTHGVTAESR